MEFDEDAMRFFRTSKMSPTHHLMNMMGHNAGEKVGKEQLKKMHRCRASLTSACPWRRHAHAHAHTHANLPTCARFPVPDNVLTEKILTTPLTWIRSSLVENHKRVQGGPLEPFRFRFSAHEGQESVQIVGSWSDWWMVHDLVREENDWVLHLLLPVGEHTFKFLVNGEWALGEYEMVGFAPKCTEVHNGGRKCVREEWKVCF